MANFLKSWVESDKREVGRMGKIAIKYNLMKMNTVIYLTKRYKLRHLNLKQD